jgi:dTDP-4-dehydrorhamnose reductase
MDTKFQRYKPEIWGGIECSIVRINDSYRDQLEDIGHYERDGDLATIQALGIKALRYPVLWERHQPEQGTEIDWTWADKQLSFLKDSGISPIIGLTHHGSGPSYTNLADPNFPTLLAAYASHVAHRFPWAEYYCPVNEPLTTARFSGLYGIWFPHATDEKSFFTMLIHELRATVLAMREIRKVNPIAKLIQTEDITKVYSTPLLKYQADFENNRRWISFDLLCGKVNNQHPLWDHLRWVGIAASELTFFLDNPCPPDIIGLNYYVTSERFLDEHLDRYNPESHGGNGHHQYADVAAVRVLHTDGLRGLLQETWKRYKIPIAITEAHLHCTREEQLRWFNEIWNVCTLACNEGISIKAVTAWALLGAYDWNTLLTQHSKYYESGVFDCRNNVLRPTALANLIQSFTGKTYWHPTMATKGWWHQFDRFIHKPALIPNSLRLQEKPSDTGVLIVGSDNALGEVFCRICNMRKIPYKTIDHQALNTHELDLFSLFHHKQKPWAVINTYGFSKDAKASQQERIFIRMHQEIPHLLAVFCEENDIQLLTFSSPIVFNGEKKTPYLEDDNVSAHSFLGQCKAIGEQIVMSKCPAALILRVSIGFSPWDPQNCITQILEILNHRKTIKTFHDAMVTPAYLPDVAQTALDLLIDRECGIWHMTNGIPISWEDFTKEIARRGGGRSDLIQAVPFGSQHHPQNMQANNALQSSKGISLPDIDHALARYFSNA